MINLNAVWIALFVSFILLFLLSYMFGYASYRQIVGETRFSFMRNFPSEMYRAKHGVLNSLHRVFFYIFIGSSFGPLCVTISGLSQLGDFGIFAVVIACVCGLVGLSLAALELVEVRYVRPHTSVSTFFFALSFLFSALVAVLSFVIYSKDHETRIIQLVIGIISIIICLVLLALMFNPKLKDWARLESHKNDDGTVEFVRPKHFPLAYTEWAILLGYVLSVICFFITLLNI